VSGAFPQTVFLNRTSEMRLSREGLVCFTQKLNSYEDGSQILWRRMSHPNSSRHPGNCLTETLFS
jgi:hypothetical protein